MKKLYSKVMWSLFVITILSTAVPRLIYKIISANLSDQMSIEDSFLIGAIITGTLILILTYFWFNQTIIKRISYLSDATKHITDGDYNVELPIEGYDEISELTKHFNQMSNALSENQYVNQSFMKDYAHEFKTPIAIIKGYAEMIENTSDKKDIDEYVQIIKSESESLSRLAQNILQLSLLDKEGIVLKQDAFNLSELVRVIISSMQIEWESKSLEFNLNLDDQIFTSNKELLNILLKNIIENAIKYAKPNSIIDIDVNVKDFLEINIKNQTQFIDLKNVDKLSKLFYRSDLVKDISGHGVGLSIVGKIVELLNFNLQINTDEKDIFEVEITNK